MFCFTRNYDQFRAIDYRHTQFFWKDLYDAVTGPCTKDPEPWLTDTEGTSGPGGLDVIHFNSGADLVAYHGWSGDNVGYDRGQRSIYARFLRWVDGRPVFVDSFTDE